MEVVTILRELWRRKLLVLLMLCLSLTAGALVLYRIGPGLPPKLESRSYNVALSTTSVLVDTPNSQVVDLQDEGPDVNTLLVRANLLGNLLATTEVKADVARRAGVPFDKLIAIPPSEGAPVELTPLATGASESPKSPTANIVSISVDEKLPIIGIDTQSPSAATARKLAEASIVALQEHVHEVALTQGVPAARQVVVKTLGTPRTAVVQRGTKRMYALLAVMFVFTFGCAAIVIVTGMVRAWKRMAAEELEAAMGMARHEELLMTPVSPVKSVPPPSASKGADVEVLPGRLVG